MGLKKAIFRELAVHQTRRNFSGKEHKCVFVCVSKFMPQNTMVLIIRGHGFFLREGVVIFLVQGGDGFLALRVGMFTK